MVVGAPSGFLDSLLAERPARVTDAAWFDGLRARALERANALSVPSTRDEEWRFTDLSALNRLSFQPVDSAPQVERAAIDQWLLPEAHARLVFVDGIWTPGLSMLPPPDRGIAIEDLRSALRRHGDRLAPYLGQLAAFEQQLFVALNTAFLRDAAVVLLDRDCSAAGPIHVLHIATERGAAHAIYPRTLLVAGAGSRSALVEDFVAIGTPSYFSAPVTEIALDANASIQHVRVQREAANAFHVATCAVSQSAGSRYTAVTLAAGARLSRLDHNVIHREPGCDTQLDGLMLLGARQLADIHSFVDHAQPNGRLRQMQKCVAGARSHAVFNGKVLVREGALHTDAAQAFRGLLLSDHARIDTKPQLEIFADDVKCAHGAAIGQLDADQLFYLRSRGLGEAAARNLLTYAFAAEVIERIPLRALASTLARTVLERTQEST
jgi:Fe-S cluster assembly protein SufD